MKDLRLKFHQAMVGIYETARVECRYTATRFLQMLSTKGGLATARALLATDAPSDGFTRLWECGRLDLTVEAHVLKAEFEPLFSESERATARRRLPDAVYIKDTASRFVQLNQATATQLGLAEPAMAIGKTDRKALRQREMEKLKK